METLLRGQNREIAFAKQRLTEDLNEIPQQCVQARKLPTKAQSIQRAGFTMNKNKILNNAPFVQSKQTSFVKVHNKPPYLGYRAPSD